MYISTDVFKYRIACYLTIYDIFKHLPYELINELDEEDIKERIKLARSLVKYKDKFIRSCRIDFLDGVAHWYRNGIDITRILPCSYEIFRQFLHPRYIPSSVHNINEMINRALSYSSYEIVHCMVGQHVSWDSPDLLMQLLSGNPDRNTIKEYLRSTSRTIISEKWWKKSIGNVCMYRVCENIYKYCDILSKLPIWTELYEMLILFQHLESIETYDIHRSIRVENDYNFIELYCNGLYDECEQCPIEYYEISHELLYSNTNIHHTLVNIIKNVRNGEQYVTMLDEIHTNPDMSSIMDWYERIFHEILIQYYNIIPDLDSASKIYNLLCQLNNTEIVIRLKQYYTNMIYDIVEKTIGIMTLQDKLDEIDTIINIDGIYELMTCYDTILQYRIHELDDITLECYSTHTIEVYNNILMESIIYHRCISN